uniref:Uncharacterized protein n=1 Tax=Solanum tuberosum TaxID=4113 RepID=M1D8D8_SOLTU
MLITRRSKSTGKRVDVAAQEGTNQPPPNQAVQSKAQDESLSQTFLTPPSPEDIRREAAPQEPTINATEQDIRNVVQLLTRIVAGHGQSGKEALELAAYRLKGVAILWYEAWKQSRGTEAPSAT